MINFSTNSRRYSEDSLKSGLSPFVIFSNIKIEVFTDKTTSFYVIYKPPDNNTWDFPLKAVFLILNLVNKQRQALYQKKKKGWKH